jgi:hypothetical protein
MRGAIPPLPQDAFMACCSVKKTQGQLYLLKLEEILLLERSIKRVQNVKHKLTPWSTVLLAKLTVTKLIKKFPAFYGT